MPSRDRTLPLDTANLLTRRRLYAAIRALPAGSYTVRLKRKRWQVSDAQRGYYFGYLIAEVSKLIGKDREETDKILNALFLTKQVEVAGQAVAIVLSLSDLATSSNVSEYFRQVRLWVFQTYRVKLREPDPEHE